MAASGHQRKLWREPRERLGFRLIEDTDFNTLKELDMDPAVRTHFPEGVLTPAQIKKRISKNKASFRANGFGDFAVVDLENGQFTGRAGFSPMEGGDIEVGYVFLKRCWGRGLAQESLRALLAWARDNLDVPRIVAYATTTCIRCEATKLTFVP